MTFPVFASGDVLNASDMNAVGLWLVKAQTIGSAVSSVQVTSAFSSDYINYRVVISGGGGSTDSGLRLTFGSTTTAYYSVMVYYSAGAVGDGIQRTNNSTYIDMGLTDDATGQNFYTFDIGNPQQAIPTSVAGFFSSRTYNGFFGGLQASNTQFTSFTVAPASGTLTGGTIKVYGYRD